HAYGTCGPILFEEGAGGLDAVVAQQRFNPVQHGHIDLDRGLGRSNLDSGRLAEEVWQGVEQPDDQSHRYGEVLPEGITVHARSACGWTEGPRDTRPEAGLRAIRAS